MSPDEQRAARRRAFEAMVDALGDFDVGVLAATGAWPPKPTVRAIMTEERARAAREATTPAG
jgi:hypothetical protein